MDDLRKTLLASGVRNLKQFGYPTVTPENIMTDMIYRTFFKSMLEETRDAKIVKTSRNAKTILPVVNEMLAEIEALDKKEKVKSGKSK